jgi:hypothetical protein
MATQKPKTYKLNGIEYSWEDFDNNFGKALDKKFDTGYISNNRKDTERWEKENSDRNTAYQNTLNELLKEFNKSDNLDNLYRGREYYGNVNISNEGSKKALATFYNLLNKSSKIDSTKPSFSADNYILDAAKSQNADITSKELFLEKYRTENDRINNLYNYWTNFKNWNETSDYDYDQYRKDINAGKDFDSNYIDDLVKANTSNNNVTDKQSILKALGVGESWWTKKSDADIQAESQQQAEADNRTNAALTNLATQLNSNYTLSNPVIDNDKFRYDNYNDVIWHKNAWNNEFSDDYRKFLYQGKEYSADQYLSNADNTKSPILGELRDRISVAQNSFYQNGDPLSWLPHTSDLRYSDLSKVFTNTGGYNIFKTLDNSGKENYIIKNNGKTLDGAYIKKSGNDWLIFNSEDKAIHNLGTANGKQEKGLSMFQGNTFSGYNELTPKDQSKVIWSYANYAKNNPQNNTSIQDLFSTYIKNRNSNIIFNRRAKNYTIKNPENENSQWIIFDPKQNSFTAGFKDGGIIKAQNGTSTNNFSDDWNRKREYAAKHNELPMSINSLLGNEEFNYVPSEILEKMMASGKTRTRASLVDLLGTGISFIPTPYTKIAGLVSGTAANAGYLAADLMDKKPGKAVLNWLTNTGLDLAGVVAPNLKMSKAAKAVGVTPRVAKTLKTTAKVAQPTLGTAVFAASSVDNPGTFDRLIHNPEDLTSDDIIKINGLINTAAGLARFTKLAKRTKTPQVSVTYDGKKYYVDVDKNKTYFQKNNNASITDAEIKQMAKIKYPAQLGKLDNGALTVDRTNLNFTSKLKTNYVENTSSPEIALSKDKSKIINKSYDEIWNTLKDDDGFKQFIQNKSTPWTQIKQNMFSVKPNEISLEDTIDEYLNYAKENKLSVYKNLEPISKHEIIDPNTESVQNVSHDFETIDIDTKPISVKNLDYANKRISKLSKSIKRKSSKLADYYFASMNMNNNIERKQVGGGIPIGSPNFDEERLRVSKHRIPLHSLLYNTIGPIAHIITDNKLGEIVKKGVKPTLQPIGDVFTSMPLTDITTPLNTQQYLSDARELSNKTADKHLSTAISLDSLNKLQLQTAENNRGIDNYRIEQLRNFYNTLNQNNQLKFQTAGNNLEKINAAAATKNSVDSATFKGNWESIFNSANNLYDTYNAGKLARNKAIFDYELADLKSEMNNALLNNDKLLYEELYKTYMKKMAAASYTAMFKKGGKNEIDYKIAELRELSKTNREHKKEINKQLKQLNDLYQKLLLKAISK